MRLQFIGQQCFLTVQFELVEFASFISQSPEAGALIRGSGGVRIIYLARNEAGKVYHLTLYAKSESENISLITLKEIRRALEI